MAWLQKSQAKEDLRPKVINMYGLSVAYSFSPKTLHTVCLMALQEGGKAFLRNMTA